MDFSEVLKELRESNCITQEQLARQIDVSRSTIAGYESKNRELDFDEHIIDRKVIKIYKNLGFEEKKDALKYLELLEYKSKR